MNPPKGNEHDYINFLIATQKAYSCMEAERVQPESDHAAAHDAITQLLDRLEPSTSQLWQEAQPQVRLNQGILVVDDLTLDKWYAFEDGIGDSALVWQAWAGDARHQLDDAVMDARRPSHSLRLPLLREEQGWSNQESPLPLHAGNGKRTRV